MTHIPEGRKILVTKLEDSRIMQFAKNFALLNAKDPKYKLGSALVKHDKVMAFGANGNDYHDEHGCERQRLNIPTGQDHHICPGCDPSFHSEQQAIASALKSHTKEEIDGFDLYMWGHYHCCKSCWDSMIEHGVRNVYISAEIFNDRNEIFDNKVDIDEDNYIIL